MSNPPTTGILAIVQPEDAPDLLTALAECGCGATYLAARGGFLSRHAVAVLTVVPADRERVVIAALRRTCSRRTTLVTPVAEAEFGFVPEPIEVEIGGAVVFGLPAVVLAHWGAPRVPTPLRMPAVAGGYLVGAASETVSPTPVEEATMFEREPTRLIVAVVPDRAAGRVVAALVERRYGATTIGSTGGFLRRGNTTILTGVPAAEAGTVAGLIETACREAGDGGPHEGGIAFALDVDWRLRI